MNAPKQKSGLAQMRESIARLNEAQGLLAAKTVMELSAEPESERTRLLKMHAQSKAAMHATAVRVTTTTARNQRQLHRQRKTSVEKLIEEVQSNASHDTPAKAKSKGS